VINELFFQRLFRYVADKSTVFSGAFMKIILLLLNVLMLSACGGNSSSPSDITTTPIGTVVNLSSFREAIVGARTGDQCNFPSLTGTDSLGRNWTGSILISSLGTTTYNGKSVTESKVYSTLQVSGGSSTTHSSTSYFLSTNSSPYISIDSTGVTSTAISEVPIPSTATIGQSGNLASTSESDGSTTTATWALNGDTNGGSVFVISATTTGGSGGTDVSSYHFDKNGFITQVSISITANGLTVNLSGRMLRFNGPTGMATDGTNLYVADSSKNIIRKVVIATGEVTPFVGNGTAGSTDGVGSAASFNNPMGIATDGTNLFVADTHNNTIRKVVISTGVVTTLAGNTTTSSPLFSDGTGSGARFNSPRGLTTDGTNLYVADFGNNAIRKIVIATGVATTIAGYGSPNGNGANVAVQLQTPTGIATDGTNLFVTDSGSCRICKVVIANGSVTILAGSVYGLNGSTDGTGTTARFYFPDGITSDGTNLFVADTYSNTIRKVIIATGVVSTLAGNAGIAGTTDGVGSAALFWNPRGVIVNGKNLYVTDTNNSTIRKVEIGTGAVNTIL
jgi:sugar lactone lactonase YvrE